MRVKLFSMAAATPIQSLEDDINEFLESQRPHVTYVSVSSSDIERVASVWYEEPHHRTVEQTMAELEELAEEPGERGQSGVKCAPRRNRNRYWPCCHSRASGNPWARVKGVSSGGELA